MEDTEKLEEFIKKYKDDPVKFAEDFLGIKFNFYQKIMLKELNKNKDKKIFFIPGRRSYLPIYEDASNLSLNDILNKKES